MNVFTVGMEDLSRTERRTVRRAITRGEELEDPRLAAALVRHTNAYFADTWRYELVNAALLGVTVALTVALVSLVMDGLARSPFDIVFWGLAMGAAQLLIGRPLRRSQFSSARRRHVRGD